MNKHTGRALAASAALTLLFAQAPARGEVCETYCDQYIEGRCVKYAERCTEDQPPPRPQYGAIAYGRRSEAYGYSYGWESRAKAESVALGNCRKHGDDCETMVWFDRKCGAVAAAAGEGYWGLGDTLNAAKSDALRKCRKSYGEQCEVKASQCSR